LEFGDWDLESAALSRSKAIFKIKLPDLGFGINPYNYKSLTSPSPLEFGAWNLELEAFFQK
jgi:hypothetical protein